MKRLRRLNKGIARLLLVLWIAGPAAMAMWGAHIGDDDLMGAALVTFIGFWPAIRVSLWIMDGFQERVG